MSVFNKFFKDESKVLNHEKAEAYKLSAEMELYSVVVTSSLSSKFYETTEEQIDRIAALIRKCDHQFVAQLAVYARTKMNLRSIPLFLIVELAKRLQERQRTADNAGPGRGRRCYRAEHSRFR